MKKISAFFLFTTICLTSKAQEAKQERVKPVNNPKAIVANSKVVTKQANGKSTTMSIRAGESQVTHDNTYYQNEIAKIDSHILAINTKISSVNSDSEERAIANESGWFSKMEVIKSKLEKRKVEIQNHLN